MASIAILIGVAVYFSAKEAHKHSEKKRALKAQEALERGSIEDLSTSQAAPGYLDYKRISVANYENLPPYNPKDQHSALTTGKKSVRHHGSRLREYLQGRSEVRMNQ